MNKKWSGLESGWIVDLKFVFKDETSDTYYDRFIIANDRNTYYSLVSLSDGEVIATADSIDRLKSIAETNCDSNIELLNKWSDLYDFATEF